MYFEFIRNPYANLPELNWDNSTNGTKMKKYRRPCDREYYLKVTKRRAKNKIGRKTRKNNF